MSALAILRYWREGIISALLLAVAAVGIGKGMVERENGKLKTSLHEATELIERERAAVRAKTALAQAQDAAHAATVERNQIQATQEVSDDHQKQLAALRARYHALRVRAGASATDPSRRGTAPVPSGRDPSPGSDGTAGSDGLSGADRLIASEQALRLKALQDWVRAQGSISR